MTLMQVERLAETVGARVTGINADLLATDAGLADALMDALEENGVLVLPELNISPEAQVAFCERLGEVDYEQGHHPVRGIYRVSLDKSKNSSADYMVGTFLWHIDGCTPLHGEYPQKATLLSAVAVAASGGETEFASSYAAYDLLTDAEKEQYDGLRVVHTLEASQSRVHPNATDEQRARWAARPSHVNPLVWTHRNGRKSLVLSASADYIEGVDREQGRALLDDLLARATAPERVYRHEWSVGDTVIWDNRGVIHRASPYAPDSQREMLRTTVLGDEPMQ